MEESLESYISAAFYPNSMPTSSTGAEPANRPTKRMRLGTKSCFECRRRKIRCDLIPGALACHSCILHEVPCDPQRPAQPIATTRDDANGLSETELLRHRLAQLEATVQRLSNQAPQTPDSTPNGTLQALALQALDDDSGADAGEFYNAPLLRLLEDCSLRQGVEGVLPTPLDVGGERREEIVNILRLLVPFLPSAKNLEAILATTEVYWPTWPLYFTGPTRAQTLQGGQSRLTAQELFATLETGRPGLIAKTVSWLALCIQMLPKKGVVQNFGLAAHPVNLIGRFLKDARRLVCIDDDLGGSLECIEATVIQHRINLDMGRPRRSWILVRHALSMAICLGLHSLESSADERRTSLWAAIWKYERQEAALLGLPTAISTQDPTLLESPSTESNLERILRRISVLYGRIVDRDQHYHNATYATTVQMDYDADEVRSMFPVEWWQRSVSNELPYLDLFYREASKFQYFLLLKLIHMPYMLKSIDDTKYAHSLHQTVIASSGMLQSYVDFRIHPQALANFCESMDFYTFSAAVTLIIALLSQPQRFTVATRQGYWKLIEDITMYLHKVGLELGSTVAKQAADVLDVLIAARHGKYLEQESYIVSIPYFGRIRLNYAAVSEREATAATASTSLLPDHLDSSASRQSQITPYGVSSHPSNQSQPKIELQTNVFGHRTVLEPIFDQELGCNWASESFGDQSFDWSHIFDYDTYLNEY